MALDFWFKAIGMLASAVIGACATPCFAEDKDRSPCTEDAMLVFDASGSMAGNERLGIATQDITRIDKVRTALAKVLPTVTHLRRVGLITYGPGPYAQCNVHLSFAPKPDAASLIMSEVNRLVPAGKTPLASAVEQAADVLDYTKKPGVVVLLTDGEETCGGTPCDLGKFLHADAVQLTVHVIGYRVKDFSWTGEQSILDVKCLAEQNGGIYVAAENEAELEQALEKTLGCPMLSNALP
jgi:Ca-activated chloride channel homolog